MIPENPTEEQEDTMKQIAVLLGDSIIQSREDQNGIPGWRDKFTNKYHTMRPGYGNTFAPFHDWNSVMLLKGIIYKTGCVIEAIDCIELPEFSVRVLELPSETHQSGRDYTCRSETEIVAYIGAFLLAKDHDPDLLLKNLRLIEPRTWLFVKDYGKNEEKCYV